MPSQIVGTPAVHVTPSWTKASSRLSGIEVLARVHELRAEHRGEVRISPRVRVEHRHDGQDRVRLRDAEPHRVAGGDAEHVQHRRPVRVQHPLREPGRAARVTHGGRLVLVELRIAPGVGVRSADELLVRVLDDEHVLDRRSIHELIQQRHEALVDDHDLVARVRRDVGEIVRMQTQIQRVQHEPAAGNPEVCLVVLVVVPAQRRHAIAALEPELLQPDGECARPAAVLAVGGAVKALVRKPGDDLVAAVVLLGPPQQGGKRQLVVHHQTVHVCISFIAIRFARSSGLTTWPSRST